MICHSIHSEYEVKSDILLFNESLNLTKKKFINTLH
jgi:hypothetical protein